MYATIERGGRGTISRIVQEFEYHFSRCFQKSRKVLSYLENCKYHLIQKVF